MKQKSAIICVISLLLTVCTFNVHGQGDTAIVIEYLGNQRVEFGINGHFTEEVAYHALGKHGEYFFTTPGDWTEEFMQQLIAVSEDAIKFAKDWLGYDGGELIRVFYGNVEVNPPTNPDSIMQTMFGIGMASHGEFFITAPKEDMPVIIVHEAVHAILRLQGRKSNFPTDNLQWLEEGLCNVIDYLFFLETEHIYDTRRYGTSRENMEAFLHVRAWQREALRLRVEPDCPLQRLHSHDTAASFVFYLLEHKGTKDDFMRFFDDVTLAEEIYGMTMIDMIAEWLEYIEQYRRRGLGTRNIPAARNDAARDAATDITTLISE